MQHVITYENPRKENKSIQGFVTILNDPTDLEIIDIEPLLKYLKPYRGDRSQLLNAIIQSPFEKHKLSKVLTLLEKQAIKKQPYLSRHLHLLKRDCLQTNYPSNVEKILSFVMTAERVKLEQLNISPSPPTKEVIDIIKSLFLRMRNFRNKYLKEGEPLVSINGGQDHFYATDMQGQVEYNVQRFRTYQKKNGQRVPTLGMVFSNQPRTDYKQNGESILVYNPVLNRVFIWENYIRAYIRH